MTLNHELSNPQVQNQLHWLLSHPGYLKKLTHSEPYIYYIVNELKKRKLPGELALIPMIESTYDPSVHSGSGATGLWQLMPRTGRDFGLKQNRGYDGRRSIKASTEAALNYLTYLNNYFRGNWLLTIAAYQAGEGTIGNAIRNSRQTRTINFWQLSVSNVTKMYTPRILALAEIIKNPKRYHISLPNIPNSPYFDEVQLNNHTDINQIAKLTGTSYITLIKLNPDYNPKISSKLLIPVSKVSYFNKNIANLSNNKQSTSISQPPKNKQTNYTVVAGDNLSRIAKRLHMTIRRLKQLNPNLKPIIKPGQKLIIS